MVTLREAAQLAQDVIAAQSGDTDRVTLINHGHASVVAVVDRQVVIKFPRSPYAATRNAFELFVLNEIGSLESCEIPTGLTSDPQSSSTALSFLAGESRSYRQLQALPEAAQQSIGASIGEFASELHSSLDAAVVNEKRRELELDQLDEAPWPVHFERTIRDSSFRTEQQKHAAMHIYDEWCAQMVSRSQAVAIHDDLHADNLRFDGDTLVGVLDFGEVTVGSPEQELRHCFWISDRAGHAAISRYEACTGVDINRRLVWLWSVTQELAAYSEYSQARRYDHPSFLRATSSLERLVPTANWISEPAE